MQVLIEQQILKWKDTYKTRIEEDLSNMFPRLELRLREQVEKHALKSQPIQRPNLIRSTASYSSKNLGDDCMKRPLLPKIQEIMRPLSESTIPYCIATFSRKQKFASIYSGIRNYRNASQRSWKKFVHYDKMSSKLNS